MALHRSEPRFAVLSLLLFHFIHLSDTLVAATTTGVHRAFRDLPMTFCTACTLWDIVSHRTASEGGLLVLKVIRAHRPITAIPPQAFQAPICRLLAWIKIFAVPLAVLRQLPKSARKSIGRNATYLVNLDSLLVHVVSSSSPAEPDMSVPETLMQCSVYMHGCSFDSKVVLLPSFGGFT